MPRAVLVSFLLTFSIFVSCSTRHAPGGIDSGLLGAFGPLPEVMASQENAVTPEKVALGRRLYFDTRLSRDGDISCNTCHPLERYGADGLPVSAGHRGQKGDRNSPTVYNAAGHFVQFWDGRAKTIEEQAKGPILNPVEMAMESGEAVVEALRRDPSYVEAFAKAFPGEADPLTFDNVANAIGAFERTLTTPSRWDAFLRGEETALTPEEKAGFLAFTEAGCMTCHRGVYVGGEMYSRLGIVKAWPDKKDPGRYRVTQHERDRFVFKVPGLRNVTKTAPYLHDGSIVSLEEVVRIMAEYQLGKTLADEKVAAIVTWLDTLTGELPPEFALPAKRPAELSEQQQPPAPDSGSIPAATLR